MNDANGNISQTLAELQERIDYLEVKQAYQDDTIEKLNQTVIHQQRVIDTLTTKNTLIIEKLNSLNASNLPDANEVELPPHY